MWSHRCPSHPGRRFLVSRAGAWVSVFSLFPKLAKQLEQNNRLRYTSFERMSNNARCLEAFGSHVDCRSSCKHAIEKLNLR